MVKLYIIIVICVFCSSLYGQVKDTSSNDELMVTFIENPPIFKGDLTSFLKGELKYPYSDSTEILEGKVIVSYWIDTTGITIDHKIVKGLRKDLDEEALRVTKLIRYEKPAKQRGKPIKVKCTIPLEFKMEMKIE